MKGETSFSLVASFENFFVDWELFYISNLAVF